MTSKEHHKDNNATHQMDNAIGAPEPDELQLDMIPDIEQELSEELSDQPGSLVAFHCDLNDSEQIETLFNTIGEQFGGVDVCINNAGIFFAGSLLDGDVDKWRTMLNVNVLAAAHCAKLAVRSMRDRDVDEGQVININSLCGHRVGPNTDLHFYAASKFALTGLTEGLRQELAAQPPTKIRVAQVSPGIAKTEIEAGAYNERGRVMEFGMDAKNIADGVVYILSTPPELQAHDILVPRAVEEGGQERQVPTTSKHRVGKHIILPHQKS